MTKKSLKASSRSNHSKKSQKKNRTNDKHKKSKTEIKQSENYQKKAEKRLHGHVENAATGGVKIQLESAVPTNDTKAIIDQELSNVRNVEQVKMAFKNQVMIRELIHADDIKSEFDDLERFTYTITRNSSQKKLSSLEENLSENVDQQNEEDGIMAELEADDSISNVELFKSLMHYGFERDDVTTVLNLFDTNDSDDTDAVKMDCLEYMWKNMVLDDTSEETATENHDEHHSHQSRTELLEEELLVMQSMFDEDSQRLTHNESLTFFSIELECDGNDIDYLRDHKTYLHIYIPESCDYPQQTPIFVIENDHIPIGAKRYLLKQLKTEANQLIGTSMMYQMYTWIQFNIAEKIGEWREQGKNLVESQQLIESKVPEKEESIAPAVRQDRKKKGKKPIIRSKNVVESSDRKLSKEELTKLSEQLLSSFMEKRKSEGYQRMQRVRGQLPVFEYRDEILEAIHKNQVVLITADTGAGKTTQIPQFILDDMLLSKSGAGCNIICTQPRRISAIGVAERVAAERDEAIGGSIGYSIQLESKRSSSTKLLFCTTGVLLRMVENDPSVSHVTHIIVDEVHERSLDSDFLLIVLKQLLKQRRDIKVILMSATMNAELFSDYFNDCETLFIPGRTYPIESYYLEDVIEATGYVCAANSPNARTKNQQRQKQEFEDQSAKVYDAKKYSERTLNTLSSIDEKIINYELIMRLLNYIVKNDREDLGSVLIFLPGISEITQLYNMMMAEDPFKNSSKFMILPLHSSLSTQNQQRVFEVPKPGCRKIIISTNIAETSITIDDCTVVIDSGKMKQTQYSAQSRMSSLVECWISRANSLQRRGRAGRVRPGKAYNLYTKFRYETRFKDQQLPEIFRVSLESLCLRIKALKMTGSIEHVLSKAVEPPSSSSIKSSVNSLVMLRALDSNEELTPLGAHLSKIPIDVQLAKMMLYAAMLHCLDPVLTIAASMGNQSPFLSPINQREEARRAHQKLCVEKSDHLSLLKAYHKWTQALSDKKERVFCNVNYLSNNAFLQISQRKKQFVELLAEIGFIKITRWHKNQYKEHELDPQCNQNSHNLAMVKACLVAGLYPNVALITEKDNEARVFTPSNGAVSLHPSSVLFQDSLFENKYLVYLEKVRTSKLFIRDATMVTPYSLMLFGGQLSYDKDSRQLTVDKWIKFRVEKEIAVLMDQLRIKVSMYLERLIERQHKSESEVTEEELQEENSLVLAISELLGSEHSIHAYENWWSEEEKGNKK